MPPIISYLPKILSSPASKLQPSGFQQHHIIKFNCLQQGIFHPINSKKFFSLLTLDSRLIRAAQKAGVMVILEENSESTPV
jgi:hypothetical protein